MLLITDFELHKLTLPLGRVVGDNNCSYEIVNVLAIALKTNEGVVGWGYSESVWKGNFKNSAWYVRELPDVSAIEGDFRNTWWKQLNKRNAFDLESERTSYTSGYNHLDAAVRLALWDLMAQEKNVPLYKFLNPDTKKQEALAYGSILDFPLSDKEVLDLTEIFLRDGFGIIKVKVGADDVERDLRRLKLIQSYAGSDIRLTADANEVWDWQTALTTIETYLSNGIPLEYLEDPLNRDDVQGFAELTKRSPIPIIGHDYVNNIDGLRRLVEVGGLQGIRTGKDIDYTLASIQLAASAKIPVYLGNSMFEINAHLALAFDQVDRTEFSYLATNDILEQPIHFKNGYIQRPDVIGHGLSPMLHKLTEFSI